MRRWGAQQALTTAVTGSDVSGASVPAECERQGQELRAYRDSYLACDLEQTQMDNEWLRREIASCQEERERLAAMALRPRTSRCTAELGISAAPPRLADRPSVSELGMAPPPLRLAGRPGDHLGAARRRRVSPPPASLTAAVRLPPGDPPPAQRRPPPQLQLQLPPRAAVGDEVEVQADGEDLEGVVFNWYAGRFPSRLPGREDLALESAGRKCVVPSGCAGLYLKVVAEEVGTAAGGMLGAACSELPVSHRVPVIAEAELYRKPRPGAPAAEADPQGPAVPGDRLALRYRLEADVPEGSPTLRWLRGGMEVREQRDLPEYLVTAPDIGRRLQLQLTPSAPDGARGEPVIVCGPPVLAPDPAAASHPAAAAALVLCSAASTPAARSGTQGACPGLRGVAEEGQPLALRCDGVQPEVSWLRAPPGTAPGCPPGAEWPQVGRGPSCVPSAADVGCQLLACPTWGGALWSPPVAPAPPRFAAPPRLRCGAGGAAPAAGDTVHCDAAVAGGRAEVRWARSGGADAVVTPLPAGPSLRLCSDDVGSQVHCVAVPVRGSDRAKGAAVRMSLPAAVGPPAGGAAVRWAYVAAPPQPDGYTEVDFELSEGCSGAEVQWWSREPDAAAPPRVAGGGRRLLVGPALAGHVLWAEVTPSGGGVSARSNLTAVATPGGGLDRVQRLQHWLPALCLPSGVPAPWEWSADGAEWNPCGEAPIFQPGPDDLLVHFRAAGAAGGAACGPATVHLPAEHAAELRQLALAGVAAFSATVRGAPHVLVLGCRSVKVLAQGAAEGQRLEWAAGPRAEFAEDDRSAQLQSGAPGSQPFIAAFASPAELELFLSCWRLYRALAAADGSTPPVLGGPLLPEAVRRAWAKGRCCGKSASPGAAAALRSALFGGATGSEHCHRVAAAQGAAEGADGLCRRTLAALLLAALPR